MFLSLALDEHLGKVRVPKPVHQFILRIAPDRFDRAVFVESASTGISNAFIQLDGTVDRFYDLKQGDVFGFTGQGHATTRPA